MNNCCVSFLYAGTWCLTLPTPTRSRPSPATARVSPPLRWCTSWELPTVATDASRGNVKSSALHVFAPWVVVGDASWVPPPLPFQLSRWGVWRHELHEWWRLLHSVPEGAFLQLRWWVTWCHIIHTSSYQLVLEENPLIKVFFLTTAISCLCK